MAHDIILSIKGIRKSYGPDVLALDQVDLDIKRGEFVTLLGPSGSGKTTLLNALIGVVEPDEGSIAMNGRDITRLVPRARGFGMVFQSYALMPHMTIFDNVAFPLRIRKTDKTEIAGRVEDILNTVGLADLAQRKPAQLSGGQQQRVAIARCLVYRPPVILMDEPLGALDKNLREQMQWEIRSIHSKFGVTIIYVTHDQEEALTMSDRICLMNGGRIQEIGAPHELYLRPHTVFGAKFLGGTNIFEAICDDAGGGMFSWPGGSLRTRLKAPAGQGSRVHWMVRPEQIARSTGRQSAANCVTGTVKDVALFGSVMRYRLQISDEIVLTFSELTKNDRDVLQPGCVQTVSWQDDAVVLLQ